MVPRASLYSIHMIPFVPSHSSVCIDSNHVSDRSNSNPMKTQIIKKAGFILAGLLLWTLHVDAGAFALIADGGNHRVAQFYVSGNTWTYMANLVDNSTAMSDASGTLPSLVAPNAVVQDLQGRIYVSDQNGAGNSRVLRFSTNGVFIDMVGTNGLNGYNVPGSGIDDLALGLDGNIYGTLAFGTANNQILKFNVATTNWSVLYSNSATMSTPRGLACGTDGNLYVNARGSARMLVVSTNGVLLRTNAAFSGLFTTTPMGVRWDSVGNRFVCTAGNGNSVICTCTTNGTLAMATGLNPSGGPGSGISTLAAMASGSNIFYVPYKSNSRVYLANTAVTNSVTAVDTGTTPLLVNATCMNFATGFGIGSLQSVALNITRTTMIAGTHQQIQFIGNYIAQSGVDITTDPGTVLTSSDPGVLRISSSGQALALTPGVVTITASNSGITQTVSVTVVPLVTTLIHRYGFTNDASDSAGTANGTVWYLDPSGFSFSSGQLFLTPSGEYDYNYVDFGPNLISTNDAITVEAWASFGTNYAWSRLFDFGNNDGVNGTSSLFFTPHNSTSGSRLGLKTSSGEVDLNAAGLDGQTNVHIVAVIHPLAGYLKLYLNGILAAQNTNISGMDLVDVTANYDYVGKSQFYADPSANLSIDELRIYAGVLEATNVAFNYAAGPDQLVENPGALQSVALAISTNMLQQGQQTVVAYGNFANISAVPLNNFGGAIFTSSDTNVLTISADGVIKAVGFGTATITLSYGGQAISYQLTAAPLPQASYLVAVQGGGQVLKFNAVGTNWVPAGTFISADSGAYVWGTNGALTPLSNPFALAQDPAGNVYVGEAINGGRVIEFTGNGKYLATLGTEGIDFTGIPDCLTFAGNGKLCLSTAFGTNATAHVLKYEAVSNVWNELVAQTAPPSGLTSPRGIAFDPAGNIYVCNRGSFNAASRMVQEFDTNGVYLQDFVTGVNGPQAITYDVANSRFLVSVGASSLVSVGMDGSVASLATGVGNNILDVLSVGPNVFFSDWSGSGIFAVTSGSTSSMVAGGMTNPGHFLLAQLPPDLKVTKAGGQVVATWPYSVSSYKLQSSTNLSLANWQAVSVTPVQAGNEMQVILPLSSDATFFRLTN